MATPTHRIVKTPNPSVWSLAVTVGVGQLSLDPDFTPVEGTAYKDFPRWFKDNSYIKKWADYTYIASEDGPHAGEVVLIFCKNFTDIEIGTPFRTTTEFGNKNWPAILLAIAFPQVPGIHGSSNGVIGGKAATILSKVYSERRVVIPECNEGTLFITEEFFSNKPFVIPQYPTPVETEVSWDIPNGAKGSFIGLHGDILIPHTQTASAGIVQGDAAAASGVQKGQFFPATNFEEWASYYISHTQSFQNGYYGVRKRIVPPQQPDPSTI